MELKLLFRDKVSTREELELKLKELEIDMEYKLGVIGMIIDKDNKVLQRIYGVCLPTPEELEEHLNLLEEAKKRDHKKLGKELELFMMSEYGPGFPFFLHKGMILRNILENFWYEEHTKEG